MSRIRWGPDRTSTASATEAAHWGDPGGAPPGRVGHNGLASRFATGGPGRAALPAARYSATALVHTSVRRDELQRNCPTVANLLPR